MKSKLIGSIFIVQIFLCQFVFAQQRGVRVIKTNADGGKQEVQLYDGSYALVIGNSEYSSGWERLSGVKSDVAAVRGALEKHGFKVETEENLTSEQFERRVRKFINDYGYDRDNRLIIYYAGHGYTLGSAGDKRELGYIIPSDTPLPDKDPRGFRQKAVSMYAIQTFAKDIQAKHALFVFDSCFSGKLFALRDRLKITPFIYDKIDNPVRQFITAGNETQSVPDESIFRKAFVRGLEGEADRNNDGYIVGTELAEYLKESVTNYSERRQTPQYGTINDIDLDRGDFVFIIPQVKVLPVVKIPDNKVITLKKEEEQFEIDFNKGNSARDARDYVTAEAAYHRARQIDKKDARAIFSLGNIYVDQQRWEEAEKAYRQAMLLKPDTADAYIALSYVLTQPIVGSELSDRYSEAEKLARKAIEIDSENALAYDQLGVALELRGVIAAETQNAYRRAVQIEPELAVAYAHLGRLLRRSGKTIESAEAYKKAIEFSNDAPSMILVADVMQSQQKFAESEQLLRKALRTDDRNPTALFLLGRALTARGSYDAAEIVLKKSAEVSPKSFVAHMLLSALYLRDTRIDDAEKSLKKALTVVSINEKKRLAQEFEAVGDAFIKTGKWKEAVKVYQEALKLDPEKESIKSKIAQAKK